LRECGATEDECNFLVRGGGPGHWWGERVELNAMTAASLLQFVERGLQQAGVRKLTPPSDVLERAFRRAWRLQMVQEAVNATLARPVDAPIIPAKLLQKLRRKMKNSALSWDQALHEIVQQQRRPPRAG